MQKTYSLESIRKYLDEGALPFSGITAKGSAEFKFLRPAGHAGVALHAGHEVRPDVAEKMKISPADRRYEEDPHTESFLQSFPIQIVARHSRFEYDPNRPLQSAVYTTPETCWNLDVWHQPQTEAETAESLAKHQELHDLMDIVVDYLLQNSRFGILFDLHSYNYQRQGPVAWHVDPKPVINLGTGPVNHEIFGDCIQDFMNRLGTFKIDDRLIYVAENEIFKGGHLARRLSRNHYDRLLVLAIEFKKVFMNELSGDLYPKILNQLVTQFENTAEEFVASPFFKSVG
jgi:hypothetical protein